MPAPVLAALVAAVAPALARKGMDLLSGVLNGAADAGVEKVTRMIEEKTGITVEDIAEEKLTEAQWIALRDFELRHEAMLLEELESSRGHAIDRLRIAQTDRADARRLQAESIRAPDWLTRNFLHLYAVAITVLTFLFIGLAAFLPGLYTEAVGADGASLGYLSAASQARARVIDTVLGFLLGVSLSAIIQFFFGSSAGSSAKSKTLDRLLDERAARLEG